MSQLIMILLISILVLVHEAGHFIAARLCNVRVTRFGIGMPMGPEWKLFKWNKTNFYIHAFLFGGYVAFPDDMDNFKKEKEKKNKDKNKDKDTKEESDNEEDIDEDEILPSDSPELYENKNTLQKLFIVSAGVIMNVIFAIILVMFCATVFKQLPASKQNLYVDSIDKTAKVSNIDKKDVQKGDRILKINDINIDSIYKLKFIANNSRRFDDYAQQDLIEKNLTELKVLNPNIEENISKDTTVIIPSLYPEKTLNVNNKTLIGIEKYKPEGIKLNKDQITIRNEIYGKSSYKLAEDTNINDIATALSDTYKPVSITLLRNGKEINIEDVIITSQPGKLGIVLKIEELYIETTTPKSIVTGSFKYCYNTTKLMLQGLWQLIVGKVSASEMHGVIAVVKIGGDIIASKGILNGLLLTAMISLNLAIMNFLPIPALDGGHVMFLVIEKITGKKPSKELSDKITNFFFALLIILMVAICYNDIVALITKKF